jgi:hypothetical protein
MIVLHLPSTPPPFPPARRAHEQNQDHRVTQSLLLFFSVPYPVEAAERRREIPSPRSWVGSFNLVGRGIVCERGASATPGALAGVVPVPRPASTS